MRDYASLFSNLLTDLALEAADLGRIYSDMDPGKAARVALATSFYKKLCPSGNSAAADAAALDKFLSINAALPECWEFVASDTIEATFWDYFCDHLNMACKSYLSWESFDLDSIRNGMMTGPGAAQKADASTFTTKLFDGQMSFTNPHLIRYYRAALVETGLWCDAEMRRYQRFGFTRVKGGKLFFAPKNAEISRTCCTEANLNMLIQKSIGTFLEETGLGYFGITLATQPDYNRRLAGLGSIDDSFGTIDLVSASDSIMTQLLERAMKPSFLKAMIMLSRSEVIVLPNGDEIVPRMISTMGNGFTFPLQTVIFASVVKSVYQLMGFPCSCPRTQFGVFGDDIVVRREAYHFTIAMLTKLGFQVNDGKSFGIGPFRESCGHDYYRGVNIRGVYIRSLETPQLVYSAINRLNRWSAEHDVCLPNTIRLLISWARDIRVPPSESDDAGIHAPFKATFPKLDASYWFVYRCYVKRNRKVAISEPDADPEPFNPEGLGVGYLSGHIRRRDFVLTSTDDSAWKHDWSASATLRDRIGERTRYKIVRKSLPYWDLHTDTKWYDDSGREVWRRALTGPSRERWEALTVAALEIL